MSEPAKDIRIHQGDRVDNHRIGELEASHDDIRREHRELEKRVSKLEKFQAFVFGAGAAISALAGYLIKTLRGG